MAAAAAVDDFLAELATQRRMSLHTIAAYTRDLARLAELAGGTELPALTSHDLRHFVGRLHAGGLAPTSIARTLSAWRSFFQWLSDRGQAKAQGRRQLPSRHRRLLR